MIKEIILSVGIDIGTSTTQLIFSRLTMENRASSYVVPKITIVDKEVIYRSQIYFTPLLSQTEIDARKIKEIIKQEYRDAGIKTEDLQTGAVIITGETARKANANSVLNALSDMAGDFVVATAGPDLESVLSAKGAGTDRLSEAERTTIANLDVGGGTSNLAVFQKGSLKGTACLDVGGRLIKVENGVITYVFPAIAQLAAQHQLSIRPGDRADQQQLQKICALMADQLAMAVHLKEADEYHRKLYTNSGQPLVQEPKIEAVTFSGGVADAIYQEGPQDVFCYGDIGILLGRAIKNNPCFKAINIYPVAETIRATVVGAGAHTTNISGSTITYEKDKLPLKNIPVLRVDEEEEQDLDKFAATITKGLELYRFEGQLAAVAIGFSGRYHSSFISIQELAATIVSATKEIISTANPLIIVIEHDIAKVLGNALNILLEHKKAVICIDGISAHNGDYIDIGEPVAAGQVLPVVIKTLIFNN